MKIRLLLLFTSATLTVKAQQPAYTTKHFVTQPDITIFKSTGPVKNGIVKSYVQSPVSFFDVDDHANTPIRGDIHALLYIQSEMKNGKKNGITRQYLIDSLDHEKLYLIAEQAFVNDKLNGEWKHYNLAGTVVRLETFKNDSLNGLSRNYWIDGKKIMQEAEYFNGNSKYVRHFFKNGNISEEMTFVNGMAQEKKIYYETGIIQDKFIFKNDKPEGLRTYYYPDGKPWVEIIYKQGKQWTVVANYDSKGNKRNGGTLKDGSGTLLLYDDDTTVRETITFKDGVQQP